MIPRAFVVGTHLRWDGVRQRPQHLLARIARHVPVVVLEEPFLAPVDRDETRPVDGLTVVRPLRQRGWGSPFVDAQAIATIRSLIGDGPAGVWLYTPMMSELTEAFDAPVVVYDVMDDLTNFDFAPAGIVERERALLGRAEHVFAGGRSLAQRAAAHRPDVVCIPSGVETERFAVDVAPAPVAAQLRSPVFGYTGVIDERLDYALITALADAFPTGHVVMAGPIVKVDPALLPHRTNVHFTGGVAYDGLPSLLAGIDVAIMPFAHNRATAMISPTKTLEYFAAGKPVVSTAIADVVAAYGEIAFIGDGAACFIAAAHAALAASPERVEQGRAAAHAQRWDALAESMWGAIAR